MGFKSVRGKKRMKAVESLYGFDLQFLIEGDGMPLAEIRDKINLLGESVLVVGDQNLIRVHVHTKNPQTVMDFCSTKGFIKDVINDNMDTQVENFKNRNIEKVQSCQTHHRHCAPTS